MEEVKTLLTEIEKLLSKNDRIIARVRASQQEKILAYADQDAKDLRELAQNIADLERLYRRGDPFMKKFLSLSLF